MKNLFHLLLFFSLQAFGNKIYLTKAADNGVIAVDIAVPGDTIIMTGDYSYLYFGNLHGAPGKRIVIETETQATYSEQIALSSCQYVYLDGHNIKCLNPTEVNEGVDIDGKSAHIEVGWLFIRGGHDAFRVKNDQSCDQSINDWVFDDIVIHDCVCRNLRSEGMYLLTTDPLNLNRPVTCNGIVSYPMPSKGSNFQVYNMDFDSTGRPAIMLSNCWSGTNRIYNNKIRNVGTELTPDQGTGIALGTGTRAEIDHNDIAHTYTWGIASLGGSGYVNIHDNKIEFTGDLFNNKPPWTEGPAPIEIDTRQTIKPGVTVADSTRFNISNNITGWNWCTKDIDVSMQFPTYFSSGNSICGNITTSGNNCVVKVALGITYSGCSMQAVTVLPIKLLSFTAVYAGGQTLLNWSVDDLTELSYFEVERSVDDTNFTRIAELTSFSFIDGVFKTGIAYYRLKVVSLDGSFFYSPVRTIQANSKTYIVEVYNYIGQLLIKEQTNDIDQLRKNLAPGFYILKYYSGNDFHTEKVLK